MNNDNNIITQSKSLSERQTKILMFFFLHPNEEFSLKFIFGNQHLVLSEEEYLSKVGIEFILKSLYDKGFIVKTFKPNTFNIFSKYAQGLYSLNQIYHPIHQQWMIDYFLKQIKEEQKTNE